MTDPEKLELARKINILYDGIGMLMGNLQKTGRMTRAEEELARAVWKSWREIMIDLGVTTEKTLMELRGGGEWPADFFSEEQGWMNFLKGLQ